MAVTESSHTDKNPVNNSFNTAERYYIIKGQIQKRGKITKNRDLIRGSYNEPGSNPCLDLK